jgi:IclR family transcriptional regulator, pca regulon regulatory protein
MPKLPNAPKPQTPKDAVNAAHAHAHATPRSSQRRRADPPPHAALDIAPADYIAGLAKGLSVLSAFDVGRQRLNATQTAQRVGLTRAAARRYLLTLQSLGYLDGDGTQFWLTPKVLQFSGHYLASAQLPRAAQPILDELSLHTGGACSVVVGDGAEVVIVARGRDRLRDAAARLAPSLEWPSQAQRDQSLAQAHARSVMATAQGLHLGARLPLHATSTGQVLMASWSAAQLAQWLKQYTLTSLTPYTLTKPAELKQRLAQVRSSGWACASQEHELGVQALAVPVQHANGEVVGALNVVLSVAPHEAITPAQQQASVAQWLPWLQVAAQRMRALV